MSLYLRTTEYMADTMMNMHIDMMHSFFAICSDVCRV